VPVLAVTVVDPWLRLAANPEVFTVATVGKEDVQVTDEVRFCVLPSPYVPVAVNCWLVPNAIEALVGLTDSPTRSGGVTWRVAEPEIVPDTALMIADPCPVLVANPPLLIDATKGDDEVQPTDLVRFCVVLLL
jgi:hypothetical protein